jgi:glutathione S-transferase
LITLYCDGYFVNQFDGTVVVALEEKGLPYSKARALLRDGGGVPPALAGFTRIARVPALQHGDFWLTESSAIVEYLDETFPAPGYPALLPEGVQARAKVRQLMSFVRSDLFDLRNERSWWMAVYPVDPPPPPLSPAAQRDVRELVALVARLVECGELAPWNIAHADLAMCLLRIPRGDLPDSVRAFVDANLARPSVRAYVEHPRPPNPPPRALAAG